MNFFGLSMWLTIPVVVIAYILIGFGDFVIFRYLAEAVPMSEWNNGEFKFGRSASERSRYDFLKNWGDGAFLWPAQLLGLLGYAIIEYGIYRPCVRLLDYVQDSARKSTERQLLLKRMDRYQELYDIVMTFPRVEVHMMTGAQERQWREFKGLEKFVPALPDIRKERPPAASSGSYRDAYRDEARSHW